MCGIFGLYSFNEEANKHQVQVNNAIQSMHKRGPDGHGTYFHENVALAHARLAIIDTTEAASQPFSDSTGRYTIVFNGEFYNFQEHRDKLIEKGIKFRSTSDTEVLLQLYILKGAAFLEKVNGDFAIAIYDKLQGSLFISRDRMGVKPLVYFQDDDKFVFASEMKALLAFGIKKEIDKVSLAQYFEFNYIPSPFSIFKNVRKLLPGSYFIINCEGDILEGKYYSIPKPDLDLSSDSYDQAKQKIEQILDNSVRLRMISDVPLGAFLSGGIDSSVITALASRHTNKLDTFSIGYKDEPYFDETRYANLVAKKYKTNHTVFSLTNSDLFGNLHQVLDYLDEPFADSSALAVHILSMQTRKKVTVALSGDGADELFSGYNKHLAHHKAFQNNLTNLIIKNSQAFLKKLPQSRNSKFGNLFRQLNRFSEGLNTTDRDRYWRWCVVNEENYVKELLIDARFNTEYYARKLKMKTAIKKGNINEILYSDLHIVLQGDMLPKVDLMSMANSLEVRVPFLDFNLVNYVCSLPDEYKISGKMKKKILQDTFRNLLPAELYKRPKHGFEVPLAKWFKTELKSMIIDDLLSDDFIINQNIFNIEKIKELKSRLFMSNQGELPAQIWALIVFQYWWKKYFIA